MQGGTKVYIGNLSNAVDEKDLEREFTRFGRLTEVWVSHNPSGFGFVHFKDPKDASKAVQKLNGKNVRGVKIKVEMSHSNKGPGGRGGRPSGRMQGRRRDFGRGGRQPQRPLPSGPPDRQSARDRPRKSVRGRQDSLSPGRKQHSRSSHSPRPQRRKTNSFSSSSSLTPSPPPGQRRPLSPPSPSARRGSPGVRGGREYLPLPPPLPLMPPHDYDRDRFGDDRRFGRGNYNGAAGYRSRSPPLPPPIPPRYRSRSPVNRRRSPLPIDSRGLPLRGYAYERDLPLPPPLPPLPVAASRYRDDGYGPPRSLSPPLRGRSPVPLMRGISPLPPRGRSPLPPLPRDHRGHMISRPRSPPRGASPMRGLPLRQPLDRSPIPRPRSPPPRGSPPPRPRSPPDTYMQKKMPRGYSLSPPPGSKKMMKGHSMSRSPSPPGRHYSSSSYSSYQSPSPPPDKARRSSRVGYPGNQAPKGPRKAPHRSLTPETPPRRKSPLPRGYTSPNVRGTSVSPGPRGERYISRSSSSGSSFSRPPNRHPHSPHSPSSRSLTPPPRSRKAGGRSPPPRKPYSPTRRGRPAPARSRSFSRSPVKKRKKTKH